MIVHPEFSTFETAKRTGRAQIVWTTLIADLETPVSAFLKLAQGRRDSFLLESVEGGEIRGRYSFIGLRPDLIWRCFGDHAEVNRRVREDVDAFESCSDGTIASLRAIVAECRIDIPESLPPMAAGLVGYMAYDTVRLIERIPDDNPDVIGIPDGIFLRPTVMAVFDNVADTVTVVTPIWPDDTTNSETQYAEATERLEVVVADFERSLPHGHEATDTPAQAPQLQSNMTNAEFHEMVRKGKEYILAGDVFQVVLSQRYSLPFHLPHFAHYRALRRLNPSPFLFFLDFGAFSIVGSSPEILVRVRDGTVTIRPIAGTRPRGKTPEEDKVHAKELLSDPKERAEHLMLLDLGRNDVGHVAETGSVTVTEQYTIENYSHVMHIVSNVEGKLDARHDAMDALFAGFPAGTVSGAPKVRAMEIIDELETERRGVYGVCIVYFGSNGEMDTCIALRTAIIKDDIMYVQAGGGIVADSDPEAEFEESRNKAMALIRAAGEAVRYASRANKE